MILTGYVLLCAIGLILLYFGADFLIKGGGSIARTLKVPSLIIGLTLVALTGEIYEHRLHSVREIGDQIEVLLGEEYKPFPSYEDLLYSVQ